MLLNSSEGFSLSQQSVVTHPVDKPVNFQVGTLRHGAGKGGLQRLPYFFKSGFRAVPIVVQGTVLEIWI